MRWVLIALCALIAVAGMASAHDGPPYPILVDRPVGSMIFSVWADPDVGEGTFFLIFEPAPGEKLPADVRASVWVQPIGRALPEKEYASTPQQSSSGDLRRTAIAHFDDVGPWRTRFVIESERGRGEVETDVDVTPPGGGPLSMLWYAAPFALIALLWLKAVLVRVKKPS